ncbi:uncharacterized protein LOC107790859 isoform X2 [Nicotiana tabacum]|uniref:Uncharacterized protein LOC107790859 isoform X2 n=1 Tax=Nicotiana tabacum TaxID=4097 RepID=A0AC58S377_TOBAC
MLGTYLNVVALSTLFLLFSNWLGYAFFKDTRQGETTFTSYGATLYQMFLLFTASNHPDVWIPAYKTKDEEESPVISLKPSPALHQPGSNLLNSNKNFEPCISYICMPGILLHLLVAHLLMSERVGNSFISLKLPTKHLLSKSLSEISGP